MVINLRAALAISGEETALSQAALPGPECSPPGAPVWGDGEIEGLWTAESLGRFGGDWETYLGVVRAYVRHTPALLEKIRGADPADLAGYAVVAHGIKGSSRTIGAGTVGDLAEALEHAAKAGDFDLVRAGNPAFVEAVEKLLAALSAKLNVRANPKPARDAPDPEELDALRQACAAFDVDRMDRAMHSLAGYAYKPGAGAELMAWLEDKAFRLEFDQIARRLAEYLSPVRDQATS